VKNKKRRPHAAHASQGLHAQGGDAFVRFLVAATRRWVAPLW